MAFLHHRNGGINLTFDDLVANTQPQVNSIQTCDMAPDQLCLNQKAQKCLSECYNKRTGSSNTNKQLQQQPDFGRKVQRGVKQDPCIYTKLTKIKECDSWRRSFKAFAKAQDLRHILDPNYAASASENIHVFKLKIIFMYAVLTKMLRVDFGQIIIAKYAFTNNAQGVVKQLVQEATSPTTSALHIQCITEALTTLEFITWKGSAASFVCSLDDKMREIHTFLPAAEHYSRAAKR